MSRSASRRVAWGLLDQVLASGSNFLVTILAAATLPARDFGAFALAMAIAMVVAFVARGVAGDPLLTAYPAASEDEQRWGVRAGAGAVALTSVGCAVLVAGIGLALTATGSGLVGSVLLVLAAVLPAVALQDYLRFALFVQEDPRGTFLNDLLWFVLQLPLMLVVILGDGGPAPLLAAWGAAGAVAAVVGLRQARTRIGGPAEVRAWWSRHRDLWPYFLLDNLIYQATTLVLVVVISLASTLAQVGGFRAAMTLYAPLAIIGRGLTSVATAEVARRKDEPLVVRRLSLRIAFSLMPLALVWAALLTLLPDRVGERFLGESWAWAEPLLVLAGAATAVSLFTVGTVVGIRALGAAREGLTARLLVSSVVLVASSVGAVLDGAHGALSALAWSAPLQMAAWWWLLVRASRAEKNDVLE